LPNTAAIAGLPPGQAEQNPLRIREVACEVHEPGERDRFAASNERDDRLIQLLLRRGAVSLPDLIKALEVSLKSKRRLGEILLTQRKISSEDLERALRDQLKDIVCSLFAWTSGTWKLEAGEPPAESVTLKAHPLALILEGIRRIDSWARAYEVVGGMNAEYLATRGMVAASAEYRVKNTHHTGPEKCIEDAKSAVRWLRVNARRLGIDPDQVLAGGGSAGGTDATFTAYNTTYEPEGEDKSVSSKPNALVLYNPAIGTPEYTLPNRPPEEQVKMRTFLSAWKVTKGGPPAILFFGTDDALLTPARTFVKEMIAPLEAA
jgi:hypothetical protein